MGGGIDCVNIQCKYRRASSRNFHFVDAKVLSYQSYIHLIVVLDELCLGESWGELDVIACET